MKTSSPESPKAREPKSILLIGPPGSGKTSLLLGFPSLVIMELERNLDGPERFNRQRDKSLAYSYEEIYKDDKENLLPIEKWYDRLMACLGLVAGTTAETVAIDNLTIVNEAVIRKILKEQNKSEMEGRHWQPFKSHFLSLLIGKLRSLGRTTICTVHEEAITENNPSDMMKKTIVGYDPTVQGKVGDSLSGFFTDCWRCEARLGPGVPPKQTFFLQTCATTKSRYLKNSCGMPSEVEITGKGYDAIKQYLV